MEENDLFCQECGEKVEETNSVEEMPKCGSCGANLNADAKFCSQCGASFSESTDSEKSAADTKNTPPFVQKTLSFVKAKPKIFGIICAVVIVAVAGISIAANVSDSNSKAKSAASAKGTATTKASSAPAKTTEKSSEYYETLAKGAIYKEVQKKYPVADAGSTKYMVNKTEKKNGYTILYGKLYLYDKYGKATTGYSDKSGSYIRTFEVKIKNDTNVVSSCTIK